MSRDELLSDLDYVKTMAEEGRYAPAIGGRIGLWWGLLLCIALLSHWATLTGRGPLPPHMIGMIWMIFAMVGIAGTFILQKTVSGKPGGSSINNRLSAAVWGSSTILLLVFGLSLGISAAYGIISYAMMDMMMPIAFGFYAHTAFVERKFSGQNWRLIPAIIALAFVPIGILLIGQPMLYLAAVAGVICTLVIPDIIDIRNEPKTVV